MDPFFQGAAGKAEALGAFVPGGRLTLDAFGRGPLSGFAFAVKDLIDVAGVTTGCGNPDWQRTHAQAQRHAAVVRQLLDAGARFVGKTVTDELAFSLEGGNVHDGTPVNPRCPDRLPGGSSSGSAVAVAGGLADFALGTDTGGSVRVPASFCGICGMRPSRGALPLDGVMPFAPSYDVVGWFARDGRMLASVGAVLLGDGPALPPQRLLMVEDALALVDPGCIEPLRAAARGLGALEDVRLFAGEEALWLECYRVLQGIEIWSSLGPWIEATRPKFGAAIAARFADAARIAPDLAAPFGASRGRIAARLDTLLPSGTALVLPTAPGIALRRDAGSSEIASFYQRALTLTCVAGHAGLPQVSMPLAEVEGCPIGLSVIGGRGTDASLLALAKIVAAVQPARR